MSILLKFIYKFNTNPSKILARFFIDIDKITVKLTGKSKGTFKDSKNFLENE